MLTRRGILQRGQVRDCRRAPSRRPPEWRSAIAMVSRSGNVASSAPATTSTGAFTRESNVRWSGRRGTTSAAPPRRRNRRRRGARRSARRRPPRDARVKRRRAEERREHGSGEGTADSPERFGHPQQQAVLQLLRSPRQATPCSSSTRHGRCGSGATPRTFHRSSRPTSCRRSARARRPRRRECRRRHRRSRAKLKEAVSFALPP